MTTPATATTTHPMAPLPPRSENVLPDTKARETSRFVFFAGDVIIPSEKYAARTKSLGGVELDMFLTLKETGKEMWTRPDLYNAGGLLFRCAIHELRTHMLPVNAKMIAPGDREKYIPGYVQKNGRFNSATGRYEDVIVQGSNEQIQGHRLYQPFYPGDEIERIVLPSDGLRPGGVVEISPLAGKEREEKIATQLFFFPNWEPVMSEQVLLPATIRELRNDILARRNSTQDGFLREIGDAMLASCDQFRTWGRRYLKAWRQLVKDAENRVDGPIQGYNDLCEMLFPMLEVNREDTLGQAGNVADIAGQIGQAIAQAISQGLSPQQAAAQVAVTAPADPLDGVVTAEVSPGIVIDTPNQEAIEALTGTPIPNVQTGVVTGNTPELSTEPAKISIGDKVRVNDRLAMVTARPPNRITVVFEDGEKLTVAKDVPQPVTE